MGDILSEKIAWVDGTAITGNVTAGSDVSGADDSKSFTIPDGLYSGSKTATAHDTYLAADNIKDDVVIFGVTGTYEGESGSTAPVAKTGQATCYDAVANSIDCSNSGTWPGQDAYWAGQGVGVAWPDIRFTDNSDGTVTDNLAGLICLKNADNAGVTKTWADALTYCNRTYAGYSDWRLPNVKELHRLVDFAYYNPALSNDAGTGQWTLDVGLWTSDISQSTTPGVNFQ